MKSGLPEHTGKNPSDLMVLRHVYKNYDSPSSLPSIQILVDISLKVASGESIAIAGPSGSGKSTLLNIMGTLDRPSSGSVILGGREVSGLPEKNLAEIRNLKIGFIFQLHHLLPQCTVIENVLVPTLPAGGHGRNNSPDTEPHDKRAKRLLTRVGLYERLHHRPGQISVGECQRAAVVRAMINKPGLILADEPTGSLDKTAADNLTELLLELNREEGCALVVVTHSMEIACRMDRLFSLKNGKLEEKEK